MVRVQDREVQDHELCMGVVRVYWFVVFVVFLDDGRILG